MKIVTIDMTYKIMSFILALLYIYVIVPCSQSFPFFIVLSSTPCPTLAGSSRSPTLLSFQFSPLSPSSSVLTDFVLKSILSGNRIAVPTCFCLMLTGWTASYPLAFSLYP